MAGIRVTGTFKRGNDNTSAFAITKSDALLIPIQIATDIAARDNLPVYLRMSYMLCYVISENKTYRLGSDVEQNNWTIETEDYIPVTDKGLANGVVPLDANGKINPIYLDTLNLSDTYVVVDIAEMLALPTYKGNLVIVQDASADPDVTSGSATYARTTDIAGPTLADFLRVEFGASVASVNGLVGAVIVDTDSLLLQPGSLASFNTAVSNNSVVLQSAADIQALQTAVGTLETDKANLNNVLTLDNDSIYNPIDPYNPATKKYVDDVLSAFDVDPGGEEGSIQFNSSNLFEGFTNFKYLADVLLVPSIRLTSVPALDNALTYVLSTGPDGTIKRIEVAALGGGSGGHIILNETIPLPSRKNLNFVGTQVDVTDDSGNDRSTVTVREPEWGEIGGDINNQVDINNELNTKAEKSPTEAHIATEEIHVDWAVSGPEVVELSRLPDSAAADAYYKHVQQQTSNTWTINHPLGKYPSVSTTNGNNVEIIGDVVYFSPTQLTVTFKIAAKGTAYLN